MHIHHFLILAAAMFQAPPATPAAPPALPDSFGNMVTLNAIGVWVIQLLKQSKFFPWLTDQTSKLNRIASLLVAAGAAGVSIVTNHIGPGQFSIAISGLTAGTLAHFVWHWLGNYAVQKGFYKVAFAQPPVLTVPKV